MRIDLYTPHAAQKKMHASDARFKIASCGRRFGKTYMAVNELVKFANETKFSTTTWVAPTYRQSRLGFTIMVNNFRGAFHSHTKNPLEIQWHNGSITKFLSTESKDNLRGDSSDLMCIDEAAMIDAEVWTNILRPMLSDTLGKAIIISTPKSLNWFHALYQRGQDPLYPDYESFTFATSDNPFIEEDEIEEVRASLPSDVFKQEYLAEFLEGGGRVFRDVRGCISEVYQYDTVVKDHSYVIGFDIAKHQDHSCIVVLDAENNHVVYFDRFNRIDYSIQVRRVEEVARRYNSAKIILDSTGVGDPILESVKALGLDADGFLFTNTSKQHLIEHLAVQLERKSISFPDIKVLINELMSYQYELSRAGNMKYNAPSGQHDDSVIALALAAWGVKHRRNPQVLML